jgi:hypothetical protein
MHAGYSTSKEDLFVPGQWGMPTLRMDESSLFKNCVTIFNILNYIPAWIACRQTMFLPGSRPSVL